MIIERTDRRHDLPARQIQDQTQTRPILLQEVPWRFKEKERPLQTQKDQVILMNGGGRPRPDPMDHLATAMSRAPRKVAER